MDEDAFKKSGIGTLSEYQIIEGIRGDFIYWLDKNRDVEIAEVFNVLETVKTKLNWFCYLSLSGYEFHLAHYPKGSFYKKHLDQFNKRSNRMITMIIYFNDYWKAGDGGELKAYTEDG